MKKNLVKITLHGKLADIVQKETWELDVCSGAEAIHAINSQSDEKLRKYFLSQEKKDFRYDVLINGKKTKNNGDLSYNELSMPRNNIETIDFIPATEGAGGDWLLFSIGLMGMGLAGNQMSFMASMALFAQGLANLLSKPPALPEPRQISNPTSDPSQLANSYLFNGPVNVINEGGPVPIGYGRVMVGSQVIMTAYEVKKLLFRDAMYI